MVPHMVMIMDMREGRGSGVAMVMMSNTHFRVTICRDHTESQTSPVENSSQL